MAIINSHAHLPNLPNRGCLPFFLDFRPNPFWTSNRFRQSQNQALKEMQRSILTAFLFLIYIPTSSNIHFEGMPRKILFWYMASDPRHLSEHCQYILYSAKPSLWHVCSHLWWNFSTFSSERRISRMFCRNLLHKQPKEHSRR